MSVKLVVYSLPRRWIIVNYCGKSVFAPNCSCPVIGEGNVTLFTWISLSCLSKHLDSSLHNISVFLKKYLRGSPTQLQTAGQGKDVFALNLLYVLKLYFYHRELDRGKTSSKFLVCINYYIFITENRIERRLLRTKCFICITTIFSFYISLHRAFPRPSLELSSFMLSQLSNTVYQRIELT